jgi:hypothetical protein
MSDRAVVLRSNSDLVYLPDHGFVGEEGGESLLESRLPSTCTIDMNSSPYTQSPPSQYRQA